MMPPNRSNSRGFQPGTETRNKSRVNSFAKCVDKTVRSQSAVETVGGSCSEEEEEEESGRVQREQPAQCWTFNWIELLMKCKKNKQ